jgi:single-stranded DNA-binding protein
MATINSLTLVGRNSLVELIEFPSGATRARFDIVVQRGEQVHQIPCEAWGKLALKAAELEPGLLIGLIGSLTADKTVRLECLERLGAVSQDALDRLAQLQELRR